MSPFGGPRRRADGPCSRAAAREVDRIIADAQRRVADFWAHEGADYEAAAAEAARRREAS